jgi:hypothetical protein
MKSLTKFLSVLLLSLAFVGVKANPTLLWRVENLPLIMPTLKLIIMALILEHKKQGTKSNYWINFLEETLSLKDDDIEGTRNNLIKYLQTRENQQIIEKASNIIRYIFSEERTDL